jgi:hypothetical protein
MRGALRVLVDDVAAMRVVREPQVKLEAARADVAGHLADFVDRFEEAGRH